MHKYVHNLLLIIYLITVSGPRYCVYGGGAPSDSVVINSANLGNSMNGIGAGGLSQSGGSGFVGSNIGSSSSNNRISPAVGGKSDGSNIRHHQPPSPTPSLSHITLHNPKSGSISPSLSGSGSHLEQRSSYAMLSEAMSQAVSHEFSSLGSGSADGACHADDLECYSGNIQDRLGMEAIRSLHRQLDDDDNGNIDLSESDDFLREELKYDSGYEKRQKAFHYNDDMHISVKELWEAWLRSEVHNWTTEQTTDWLAQSVQLPQYVELFKQHKVTGATLPRLAVNNMHYVSNVLGIKDPIHKQKIALKAMDVVLFGPPRETGTRWKDYILVTLLLSAIIGCWYAYQQNKNAKRHLKRMAQDMEGLQKAEQALQEMQKELERARMEQENVATEKLDLERRLKEAPSLSSSSSDLELQQLKQEIEMLRSELSRAEVELVDHCWSPPPQLQSWLQYTYELENKNHLKKRIQAEKQLQQAREACEKLRRKRSSLVGAFVSTHGKSIDDVDRSIVEARNSLSDVTNELQERLHRWKQIEILLGFSIVNNNGLAYLENVLYNRNGSGKSSRGRLTNSTDELDDESVQGMMDPFSRNNISGGIGGRDDSSGSDDGDNQSVQFFVGGSPAPSLTPQYSIHSAPSLTNINSTSVISTNPMITPSPTSPSAVQGHNSYPVFNNIHDNSVHNFNDDNRNSPSISSERSERSGGSERSVPVPPRSKKPMQILPPISSTSGTSLTGTFGRAPLPPPRRTNSHQSHIVRSQSTDTVPVEFLSYYPLNTTHYQSTATIIPASIATNSPISPTHFTSSASGFTAAATEKPTTATTSGTAVTLPASTSGLFQSTSSVSTTSTATASSTGTTATSHSDTQVEDTNSTDSSNFDDEIKKRRRKLHFPFGKKSNKSKLA